MPCSPSHFRICRAVRPLWGVLGALLVSVSAMMPAQAAPDAVALVLSEEAGPYQEFAHRFRATLEAAGGMRVSVLPAARLAPNGGALGADVDVVIPVGVRAAETALQAGGTQPVLAALIPRTAYAQLKREASARDRALSAIYLDQPLARRFALVAEALPGRKKVGVVLGPESAPDLKALQTAARDKNLTLLAERIGAAEELLPALRRLLMDSEVLLAVPDPMVFSRETAQSILLTSYRAQNPLIAYSQSYVSAGALAAVYSTPAQIGQQAAELVLKLAKSSPVSLPAPQYPKYFSVSVNEQVARSMGIAMPDENALRERLMATEARE
jgi:ABC-type uncharacterized transport system substrate-binding protein